MEKNELHTFSLIEIEPVPETTWLKLFRKHFTNKNLLVLLLLLIFISLVVLIGTHSHYHSEVVRITCSFSEKVKDSPAPTPTPFKLNEITESTENYKDGGTPISDATHSTFFIETTFTTAEASEPSTTKPTTAAPVTTTKISRPQNCNDFKALGYQESLVYIIYLMDKTPKNVYCDMQTLGGGWIVIQRRRETSAQENFARTWDEYVKGFGNLVESFWLGLDALHELTNRFDTELLVELTDWNDEKRTAQYTHFKVGRVSDNYRLFVSGYTGNAGDSLSYHNGSAFSTVDKDNDKDSRNCADTYGGGGWWYKDCYHVNLNGLYNGTSYKGIAWYNWHGHSYSLKRTEMKIRQKNP